MKSRRNARIVALIIALIMLLSLVWAAVATLSARAYVTQEEIDQLREEKKEYERRKQEIQSRINTVEYEKMAEVAKKKVLDDRIILTSMEIDNMTATIDLYHTLIHEKELEVVAATNREDAQFKKYKDRVRAMEENGIITYLEIIFDSTSFADLLARLDFVGDIMQWDEKVYNDLTAAKEATKAAQRDLEYTEQEMEQEKQLREVKYEELAVQLDEASALIEYLKGTIETYTKLYEEEQAEAERVQAEINYKVEKLREQEAAAAAASRGQGTGQLMWPVPSSGEISSQHGLRMHPIHHVLMQHWGIDITADYGATIIAADSGTVIISEYSSSYGNYIVIDHGSNDMTTLYAHMSSRAVGAGEYVGKGQIIGYVGTTGVSTGPHLHFEVSVNGQKVDPEGYL